MADYRARINSRVEDLTLIFGWSTRFFSNMKNIVLSMDPEAHNRFIDKAAAAGAAIEALKSFKIEADPRTNLEAALALFDHINEMYDFIDQTRYFCSHEEYNRLMMMSMSATLSANIHNEKVHLLKSIERFMAGAIEADDTIIAAVLDAVDVPKNLAVVIAFINDTATSTNKFYVETLRRAIAAAEGRPGSAHQMLRDMVENRKDAVLGAGRLDLGRFAGPQNPLVRYGLFPKTSFFALDKIIELVGIKIDGSAATAERLGEILRGGADVNIQPPIILITKLSTSPLEFDMRGLIFADYIAEHNLQTNEQSGLNKKVLERFTTIKQLPMPAELTTRSITRIGAGDDVCILETFNDQNYRVIGRGPALLTPMVDVRGLVEGLSTRPMMYHRLTEQEIMAVCFDAKAETLLNDYEIEKRSLPSSDVIKDQISRDLLELYERRISSAEPTSVNAFRAVVLDCEPAIGSIIMDRLTQTMKTTGIGREEYMVTYVTKFDGIVREFMRALDAEYKKHKIRPLMFKERSKRDVEHELLAVCKAIVAGAVAELDKGRKWTDYDISIKEYFMSRKFIVM